MNDANLFGKEYAPSTIHRYQNEIDVEENSGKHQYIVKVWYETFKGVKMLYTFTYLQGAATGTYRLDRAPGAGHLAYESTKIMWYADSDSWR